MRWLLVIVIALCNTLGDLLNTAGMKRHGEVHHFHPTAVGRLVAALARNPFVIAGIASMAIAFFALLALLSIADLSFAVPATASSYLLETLLAKYVLKEHVGHKRWIGAALVAFGVFLVAF
jgi:drug/metabolite transporter (DMT)-like permease